MFVTLKNEIDVLRARYVGRYIPADPEEGPDVFGYDVKAFSLMAHAAFEEFAESISEFLMTSIVNNIVSQRVTVATACFLMAYGQRIDIIERENEKQDSCFTFVRKGLDEAKKSHSTVLMNNHGFSLMYLRRILTPVGVNISDGPELDSLRTLADARGTFAHTMARSAQYGDYKAIHKVLTPEKASDAVKDCLDICERIRDQANALIL